MNLLIPKLLDWPHGHPTTCYCGRCSHLGGGVGDPQSFTRSIPHMGIGGAWSGWPATVADSYRRSCSSWTCLGARGSQKNSQDVFARLGGDSTGVVRLSSLQIGKPVWRCLNSTIDVSNESPLTAHGLQIQNLRRRPGARDLRRGDEHPARAQEGGQRILMNHLGGLFPT